MQFKFGIVLLILITATSCKEKTALETTFDCSSSVSFSDTKTVKDFKKNFTIDIPENWKIQLYYDDFQSDIFTADTTKQLSETYIIDTSWKLGELKLDAEFETNILSNNNLSIVNSKFENIQNIPTFWYVNKGKKKGFDYQALQVYLKTSIDAYLEIKTEVYGSENVEIRFCESLEIINSLEFI